ncbi:MAG: hypothetical protein Q8P95_02940 [bacterium]|nr:hypothetical protein [bacterium]
MKIHLSFLSLLLGLFCLLSVDQAHATSGGGKTLTDIHFDQQKGEIRYLINDYGGRGCLPELHSYSLATGKTTTLISCDEQEKDTSGTDYQEAVGRWEKIREKTLKENAIPLRELSLSSIELDFSMNPTELKDQDFPRLLGIQISSFQDGVQQNTLNIDVCAIDNDSIFSYDGINLKGFSAPDLDMVFIVVTAIQVCRESGYVSESGFALKNIDLSSASFLKAPSATTGPDDGIPDDGTVTPSEGGKYFTINEFVKAEWKEEVLQTFPTKEEVMIDQIFAPMVDNLTEEGTTEYEEPWNIYAAERIIWAAIGLLFLVSLLYLYLKHRNSMRKARVPLAAMLGSAIIFLLANTNQLIGKVVSNFYPCVQDPHTSWPCSAGWDVLTMAIMTGIFIISLILVMIIIIKTPNK